MVDSPVDGTREQRATRASSTAAQREALDYTERWARERRAADRELIADVLRMSNLQIRDYDHTITALRQHARVALHFHPDRPDSRGRLVVEGLLDDGVYRSQFETGISSGSVTAVPGGLRDRWEEALFGGAYAGAHTAPAERPRYGALDVLRTADGPSPRFGSCFLLLSPSMTHESTLTYLDSSHLPDRRGTTTQPDAVLAGLLEECFERDHALGWHGVRPDGLLRRIRHDLPIPIAQTVLRAPSRNLNHYIEAQVHAEVWLGEDVDAVVADRAFRETQIGYALRKLAERYQFDLHWHPGSRLAVARVPDDFRGPTMPSLARRVAIGGWLDAVAIGDAVRSLHESPASWADRGEPAAVLQELKLLWHCVVRFGDARR